MAAMIDILKICFKTFLLSWNANWLKIWKYRVAYFTIVQIIFFSFIGSLGPWWYLWKCSSAHLYANGRNQCCKIHYCFWRGSIKLRLPFSICNVFFVSKGDLLTFILLHFGWCSCPVAAVKRLPDCTIVQIIFHFIWNHWAYCDIFEKGVLLVYTLEGVNSVANFITASEGSQ